MFNIHQKYNKKASELLDRIMLQGRISDIPAMSTEEFNVLLFINTLQDNILKNKMVTMKYSDKYIDLDDISSSVQVYEANNIISTINSQGKDQNSETGRSRKRKRLIRESRSTLSPSKPRDKETGDVNKVSK